MGKNGVLFILSRSIKNDPSIKAIQFNKYELKISQYANDTTVFVLDLDSVTSLLRVLSDFKEHSGQEINTTKTEVMWLGELKTASLLPVGQEKTQHKKKNVGLKMCDFKIIENTLKITWVNRIQDKSQAS